MHEEIRYFVIFFVFLIFLTLLFANFGKYDIPIYILLITCVVALFREKYFLIFLYIVILPTNGLIPLDRNLLGILGFREVVNSFTLLSLLIYFPLKKNIHLNQKIAIILTVFLFVYANYMNFINIDIGYGAFIKKLLKNIFMFFPLVLLISNIENKKISEVIKSGIYVSVIIIVLSQIFSDSLQHFGILMQSYSRYEEITTSDVFRKAGIFGAGGDVNSLSGFLAITIGFYLSRIENKEKLKKFIPVIIFAIIGILITISVTGFLAMTLIISIFLIRNLKNKGFFRFIIYIILIYIIFYFSQNLFSNIFTRLPINQEEFLESSGNTRIQGWGFFLNYIFSNLKVFFLGTRESFSVVYGWNYERVAHNFYISIFFCSGIFPVLFIVNILRKYIKLALKKLLKYNIIYTFLPLLLISMTVSDYGYFLIFILTIGLNEICNQSNYDRIKLGS